MKFLSVLIVPLMVLSFNSCKTIDKQISIEDVSRELVELEQANAYSNSKIEELGQRINLLQEELELNRQAIEEMKDVSQRASIQAEAKQKEKAPKANAGANAKKLFQSSLDNFKNKDYEKALAGFQSFILNYPKNELVANAHYWIGEIYFERGEYKAALANYGKIPEEYPLTDKIDMAILKMGFSYLKLNQKDLATAKFKEVVELYPNSQSAIVARKQLEGTK